MYEHRLREPWARPPDGSGGAVTFEISLGDGFVCVTRPVTVEPGGDVAVSVARDPSGGDPVGGSGASCTAHVAG
ncbi:MAG: hypothetical protein RJQ04_04500 [Longimicrobiales bacterium]